LLTENANDVIWTMDMDLNYTYISPAIERVQGWNPAETAALTIHDVLTPQSVEIALKRIDADLAHGAKTGKYDISERIEQVLLNLFVNASQAMPGGGELSLETSFVHVDDMASPSHEIDPGSYIKIRVTDTGIR
jgi:signal transduction histidine kinase